MGNPDIGSMPKLEYMLKGTKKWPASSHQYPFKVAENEADVAEGSTKKGRSCRCFGLHHTWPFSILILCSGKVVSPCDGQSHNLKHPGRTHSDAASRST
jgi:hypothetical protein